ncbi:hypothetical protein Gasu2_68190 [Galdieria sulphuraria]|nr:hypothetical protein Gasu2_68190 [Galdieria sulphuraria]
MLCKPFIPLFPYIVYLLYISEPIYLCILYQSFLDDLRPLSWQLALLMVSSLYGMHCCVDSFSYGKGFGAICIQSIEIFSTVSIYFVPHMNNFWFLLTTWLLHLHVLKRYISKSLIASHVRSSHWIGLLTLLLAFFGNLYLANGDHIRRVHPYQLGKELRWKMSWHIFITIPCVLLLTIPKKE